MIMLNRINGIGSALGVGTWTLGVLTAAALISGAASAVAQVPQAAPALNAAKDARAKTEVAQQKNADALATGNAGAQAAPAAQPAAPATAAPPSPGGQPPATPPPAESGSGYSYDPAGRRDPFVSLNARGTELPMAGVRPGGVPGLLIGEVTVKGTFKSPKGGFLALLQAPDGRTYTVRQGDKVFDGSVKAITQDAVVFSQDVNDPLSLVKQREVRKSIRPEAR